MLNNEFKIYNKKVKLEVRQILINILQNGDYKSNYNFYYRTAYKAMRLFDHIYLNSYYVQKLPLTSLVKLADAIFSFIVRLIRDDRGIYFDQISKIPNIVQIVTNSNFHAPTFFDFLLIYAHVCKLDIKFLKKETDFYLLHGVNDYPSDTAMDVIEKYCENAQEIIDNTICMVDYSDVLQINSLQELNNCLIGEQMAEGRSASLFKIKYKTDMCVKIFACEYDYFFELINICNLKQDNISNAIGFFGTDSIFYEKAYMDLRQYVLLIHEPLEKDLIRSFMVQTVYAIHYCHSNMISHLDLKPSNIVVFRDGSLRVIDFGNSMHYHPCVKDLNLNFTTYIYSPPEALITNISYLSEIGRKYIKNPYVEDLFSYVSVDIWALGMVFLFLLTKGSLDIFHLNYPKEKSSNHPVTPDVIDEINKLSTIPCWTHILPEITDLEKDFISSLLKYDPKERMTIFDAIKHPYISDWHTSTQ